jgi:hypothetical protein
VCLDELQWIGWTAAGSRCLLGPHCTSTPSASSTLGQQSLSPGAPSPGRLVPMSSRGMRDARLSSEASQTMSSSVCWGLNLTQERFRLTAYYLTDLAFQASREEPLAWGSSRSGTPQCTPRLVTAYMNNLRAANTAPGSTTTRRARTMRRHDPTRECNVCVASALSSSEPEPTPRRRHPAAGAARRTRGGETPAR